MARVSTAGMPCVTDTTLSTSTLKMKTLPRASGLGKRVTSRERREGLPLTYPSLFTLASTKEAEEASAVGLSLT